MTTPTGPIACAVRSASSRLPDFALVFVAAMWGGSYLANKTLTVSATPVVVLALRFVPSALLLVVLALVTHAAMTPQVIRIGLVLGAIQAVTLFLETESVARTSAVNAGVIISLAIVIAPIAEGVLSKSRLPGRYFAATLAAICGVVMLIGTHGLARPNLGDLLILIAAFTRSAVVVASARLTANKDVSVTGINTVQTMLNAILFTAVASPRLVATTAAHLTASGWAVLAFLSVGCTLLAFLLQLWAIRRTSATRASLLMGTEPVWAVLAGVLIGGESLTPTAIAGVVVVVAATIWGQQIELRWRAARSAPLPTKENPLSSPDCSR